MRSYRLAAVTIAAIVAVTAGVYYFVAQKGVREPDIILVTLDTTRADHLGTYGYFRPTSPNLDALAEQSVVFERFLVPMATTLPSHTSMFTGVLPIEHGVEANAWKGNRFKPAENLTYLAEYLTGAGYETAAFVAARPVGKSSGAAKGFTLFSPPEPGGPRDANVVTDRALAWLAHQDGKRKPIFLWVHYFDAHTPYEAPEPFHMRFGDSPILDTWLTANHVFGAHRPQKVRRKNNRYDEEVAFMDAHLGRLFDALRERPRWSRTIVAVAGDHGEGLGQHGEFGHGQHHDGQLRAPFLLRAPGLAPGRHDGLVSCIDLAPTLLGQVDLPGEADFLAQMGGRDAIAQPASASIWSQSSLKRETKGEDRAFVLYHDDWKFVRWTLGGRDELYHLGTDPFTLTNVASEEPDQVATMAAELEAWHAKQLVRRKAFGAAQTEKASPDEVEDLKALGYIDAAP